MNRSMPQAQRTPRKYTAGAVYTRVDDHPLAYLYWCINKLYCRLVHGFSWEGEDPLPPEGPAILISNHLSSVDPFILSASTKRILCFLIAKEYYQIPVLRGFFQPMGCIPVRRDKQDVGAVRKSLAAMKQGRVLCIFPEGGIERGFQDPYHGAGYLSLRSGAPVIPAHVTGTPPADSVWKALLTPSSSRVLFGSACVPPTHRKGKPSRAQIAEWNKRMTSAILALNP